MVRKSEPMLLTERRATRATRAIRVTRGIKVIRATKVIPGLSVPSLCCVLMRPPMSGRSLLTEERLGPPPEPKRLAER